jgi:hypothetical protein
MMPDALAARLALDRLLKAGRFAPPGPDDEQRRRPSLRIAARARRIGSRLRRRRCRPGRVPSGAFELEAAHELTTAQLWGVWTVAHLESALALRAWRLGAREHRARAHLAYGAALDREARAARLLAARAGYATAR